MSTSKLLKAFNNYSNDCIRFKLIFDESDLKDENERVLNENNQILNSNNNMTKPNGVDRAKQPFKPEFSHQIFGDDENIFGYRNLRIDYYLTPGSLDAYIGLNYKEKVSPAKFDGIEADDVHAQFREFGCSPGFVTNIDTFCSDKLRRDVDFKPYGIKIHEYKLAAPSQQVFEIYKVDAECPEVGDKKFLDYIDNIQTMLVYYIETSNFIDTEDGNWSHYILYEKHKSQRYVTCGYVSVYHYYAFPDRTRARVSQMLILPNYQHQGHGSKLLESVYTDAHQRADIIDVVAESPSDEFIHLRDYVTSKMCMQLESFKSADALRKGFSGEMAKEALDKFKISKLQSRRCYEILRLAITNQNKPDEWRDFRLDLKKRFYLPFIRRTKYARNSAAASTAANADQQPPQPQPQEPQQQQPAGSSTTSVKGANTNFLFTRMSGAKPSQTIQEEEEDDYHGKTTIGFGAPPSSSANKAVSFDSKLTAIKPMAVELGSKSVKFSANVQTVNAPTKRAVAFNTSNNSTEDGDDDDDDEDGDESGDSDNDDAQNEQQNIAQLLISPDERKKYLEEQFNLAITEYRKVLKRLDL